MDYNTINPSYRDFCLWFCCLQRYEDATRGFSRGNCHWKEKAVASLSPAELGKQLYTQRGCNACHSIDGSSLVGPTWKGLYGHEVVMQDGTKVTADENYI